MRITDAGVRFAARIARSPAAARISAAVLLLYGAAFLLFAPLAQADEAHDYSFAFGGDGPDALIGPTDVAVDNSTGPAAGSVYVTDYSGNRVLRFDADGHLLRMFGEGVNETTGGDVCIPASGDACGPGSPGSDPNRPNRPTYVAVDSGTGPSSGSVYVAFRYSAVLSKFDPSGHPAAGWGTSGALEIPSDQITGLAVGPDGHVYVQARTEGATAVMVHDDDGDLLSTLSTGRGDEDGIEVDAAGALYQAKGSEGVVAYDQNGAAIASIPATEVESIALDPARGEVYLRQRGGPWQTISRFEAGCAEPCSPLAGFGAGQLGWGGGIAVDSATRTVYATNRGWDIERGVGAFRAPGVLPDVTTGSETPDGEAAATLAGRIDPAGSGEVGGCHFEYVARPVYSESFFANAETAPCSPAPPFADARDVDAYVTGLELETEYLYRLVAAGENGTSIGAMRDFEHVLPRAVAGAIDLLEPTSAVLTGVVDAGGGEEAIGCRVLLAPAEAVERRGFAQATELPCAPPPPYARPTDVEVLATGLVPATTYSYRLEAWNRVGTARYDNSFTTPALPGHDLWPDDGAPPPLEEEEELVFEDRPGWRVRCEKRACVRVLRGTPHVQTWSSPRFPRTFGWLVTLHKQGEPLDHSGLVRGCKSTFRGQGIVARLSACGGRFVLRYRGSGRFRFRWRVFEHCRCAETTRDGAGGRKD